MKRQTFKSPPPRRSSAGARHSVKAKKKRGRKITPAIIVLVVFLGIIGLFSGGSDDTKADLSAPDKQITQVQPADTSPSEEQPVESAPVEEQSVDPQPVSQEDRKSVV